MAEPKEHNLLGADEATEISHRQAIAEFKDDVFPAYRDEGITLGEAMVLYHLVCIYNKLGNIEDLLEEREIL
jgi:TPP-dependent pyruvate/acetoin dehydrogenase alpha subunit